MRAASRRASASIWPNELTLGLLGREPGDDFELAALLIHGHLQARLPCRSSPSHAPTSPRSWSCQLVEPPIELVELARDLLFLGEHAPLDGLDLRSRRRACCSSSVRDFELVLLQLAARRPRRRVSASRSAASTMRRAVCWASPRSAVDDELVQEEANESAMTATTESKSRIPSLISALWVPRRPGAGWTAKVIQKSAP